MELKKAMNERRSIRSYTNEPVKEEEVQEVLQAAYESPVGMGRYDSIHLTLITNHELLDEIDQAAAEYFGNPASHPLYGAPVLILVSSASGDNVGSANVGIIVHQMALAAVDLGLGQCDIYGAVAALNQKKELLRKLNIPDGFTPLGGIVLGHSDEKYAPRKVPESHHFAMNVLK